MDIDAVIAAHAIWKSRLRSVLRAGAEASIDPDAFSDPVRCEVGRWLQFAAPRLGQDPDFQTLDAAHADFHRLAGEAALAATRDVDRALALLKAPAFQEASMATISALMRLRARMD